MADNNKMLIDATHPEETRVVVLREGRVEEFDYESAAKKLLRGSIFLAKITRVEPSLQAAFVDYGGNRHGFLAFNEIHPDYYQIPHADRQALLEAERADQEQDEDTEDLDEDQADLAAEHDADVDAEHDDGADTGDGEIAPASAAPSLAPSLNDDDDDGDDDVAHGPDEEALAIDVSDLLPPEPPIAAHAPPSSAAIEHGEQVSATAETSDDAEQTGDPQGQTNDGSEEAAPPADPGAAAIAQAPAIDEASGEDADADGAAETGNAPRGKPKTIAAATPPDERIVSDDIVENADTATEQLEPAPTAATDLPPAATLEADVPAVMLDDDGVCEATSTTATDDAQRASAAGSEDQDRPASEDQPAFDHQRDPHDANPADDIEARAPAIDPDGDPDSDTDGDADETGEPDEPIDEVGDDTDALGEVPVRRRRRTRNYKIQEVIRRRQVVLVQVVKEERGNKGAALTTYLSLAGRYTVLMPNTARGGGISRKITSLQDRKRLKAIAQELDVPNGMGLIIRTAGASRTKQEIKRDFEYLLRLWENVRDLTLRSTAPSLVYEEGDLIKRSIRDLYSKDINQILVAGENAHKEAKGFMRMLMPSHAKNVIKYDEAQPLFARYRIEQQLNAMFSPFVQLKSGGYLVINQTEALVAVDVNSGKATRKFSIEDTALNTNLEAAEELSRQLKLRDLAGLIVIDFIDMEEKRNNRAVERRLKECLRDDRARIQVGRISHFGLLEMSRQRLRTGVLEGSTMPCHHCQGTGIIRSTESVALAVLRGLEDTLMVQSQRSLTTHCSPEVAMYLLNHKRSFILDMELRYGIDIHINASDDQHGADFAIERMGGGSLPRRVARSAVNVDSGFEGDEIADADHEEAGRDDGERRPRRRRRRRGRRIDNETVTDEAADVAMPDDVDVDVDDDDDEPEDAGEAAEAREDGDERTSRRRRRGRRGGRRNRGERAAVTGVSAPGAPQPEVGGGDDITAEQAATTAGEDAETTSKDVANQDGGEDDGANQPVASSADTVVATVEDGCETNQADGPVTDGELAATDDQPDAELDDTSTVQEPTSDRAETAEDAGTTEDQPSRAHWGEPVSSAPVLERVVMTPEADGERAEGERSEGETSEGETSGEAQQTADRPARKGWWQRRFGS